jgi:ATP-dependent Lon protease
MATALASLVTGRRVRPDTAMTGEITLTGQVLPIGGLREKAIAAQRLGFTRVIAPKQNEVDHAEFPPSLKKDVRFVWVETIGQVLEEALDEGRPRRAEARNGARRRRSERLPAAARGQ